MRPARRSETLPISSSGKKMVTSAQGRVCAEPQCSTVLSVYNQSARCSIHALPTYGRGPWMQEHQRGG
jgi:hypothetical protein